MLALLLLLGAPALPAEPLLWEVASRAGAGRMFLLGSIHYGTQSMYPLPAPIERAFAVADTLVVELDLTRLDPLEAGRLVAEHGLLPPGEHVRDRLEPATWEGLREAARRFSLSESALARQKAWMIGTTLTSIALEAIGYREALGVDRHFLGRAEGREIVALESLALQLELFDGFTADESEEFLREVLAELGDGSTFFRDLTAAWQAGDEARLVALTNQTLDGSEAGRAAKARLLDERNVAMAARLAELLSGGPERTYFVVVGAGHLIGPGGIAAKLASEGFPVSRRSPP